MGTIELLLHLLFFDKEKLFKFQTRFMWSAWLTQLEEHTTLKSQGHELGHKLGVEIT